MNLLYLLGGILAAGVLFMSKDVIGSEKDIFPDNLDRLIVAAAKKWGLSPVMVKAVAANESMVGKFQQLEAIGGTTGIMHIKLETAREFNPRLTAQELARPEIDIEYGVRYLKKQYDRYKAQPEAQRVRLAVMAYNGGPGRADQILKLERTGQFTPLNSSDSRAKFDAAQKNMLTYWQRFNKHSALLGGTTYAIA